MKCRSPPTRLYGAIFQKAMLPPSSGRWNVGLVQQGSTASIIRAMKCRSPPTLYGAIFRKALLLPSSGRWNVGLPKQDYTVLYSKGSAASIIRAMKCRSPPTRLYSAIFRKALLLPSSGRWNVGLPQHYTVLYSRRLYCFHHQGDEMSVSPNKIIQCYIPEGSTASIIRAMKCRSPPTRLYSAIFRKALMLPSSGPWNVGLPQQHYTVLYSRRLHCFHHQGDEMSVSPNTIRCYIPEGSTASIIRAMKCRSPQTRLYSAIF
jgi:hypothetical protein